MPGPRTAPQLWIRIDLGDGRQIGPGKVALLRAIDEHRSIAAAARAMGMSYRRAWLLVDEVNRALDAPAIETFVGGSRQGGAALTEMGRDLLALYEEATASAGRAAESALRRMAALARGKG